MRNDALICTLANSEVPDEMPHNAVNRHGLYQLLGQKQSSEKEIQSYSEVITCGPSIYPMDHSDFIVSMFREISIGLKSWCLMPAFVWTHRLMPTINLA